MNTAIYVAVGIAAALAFLAVIMYLRSNPKTKTPQATTPSTGGAKTSTFSWNSVRDAWFPIIAGAAFLLCWYIISPDSMVKAVWTKKFLALIVLAGTAYFFLSVHAPFKENKLRKLMLLAFFLWGVSLLLDVSGINISKSISNAFSSKSRSTVLDGGRFQPIEVNVTPDKWTPVKLSPGTNYTIERFGRLEYLLSNGRIVVAEDGENVALGMAPSINFKLRGTAGKVVFTPTQ